MNDLDIYNQITRNINDMDHYLITDIHVKSKKLVHNQKFVDKFIKEKTKQGLKLKLIYDRDGVPFMSIEKQDYNIEVSLNSPNLLKFRYTIETKQDDNYYKTTVNKYNGFFFEKENHDLKKVEFMLFESDMSDWENKRFLYKKILDIIFESDYSSKDLIEMSTLLLDYKIEQKSMDSIYLDHMMIFKYLALNKIVNNTNKPRI